MKDEVCYIGLGSNIGDSLRYLQTAVQQLNQCSGISVVAVSSVYSSEPQGPKDQPNYLNAVVRIKTTLSPQALLANTQRIEALNQRDRSVEKRWGARTLDLDILLYGSQLISTPDLKIPHPLICYRSFVLYPLQEVIFVNELPDGNNVNECLASCESLNIKKTALPLFRH